MLTPAVEQLFNITDSDIGRPITDFTHRLDYDGVEDDARKVLKDLDPAGERGRDPRRPLAADAPAALPHRRGPHRGRGAHLRRHHQRAGRPRTRCRQSEERYRDMFDKMEQAALKHAADRAAFERERDRLLGELGRG